MSINTSVCTKCRKEFDADGFKKCSLCRAKRRAWYKKNREAYLKKEDERTYERRHTPGNCTNCGRPNESERFKTCDACREIGRRYRQKHGDKIRASQAIYRAGNRKYLRELTRKWQKKNREEILERQRKEYWKNPEKERERARGWCRNNPEKVRILVQNRRARIKGNGGKLPHDAEIILFKHQDGLCYLCGKPFFKRFDDPPTIDHKIPISRGGVNDMSNVGLAHLSCNQQKWAKTDIEYREWLGKKK